MHLLEFSSAILTITGATKQGREELGFGWKVAVGFFIVFQIADFGGRAYVKNIDHVRRYRRNLLTD